MLNQINYSKYKGLRCIILESSKLRATILFENGCNLISLFNVKTGSEYLYSFTSKQAFHEKPYIYGNPLLFPPNRLKEGRLKTSEHCLHLPQNDPKNGRNHIHGILYDTKWEPVSHVRTSDKEILGMQYIHHEGVDTFHFFPFHFQVDILFSITVDTFDIEITIKNKGLSPIPLGFGYHTAFSIPFKNENYTEDTEYQISVPVTRKLELDDNGFMSGKSESINTKNTDENFLFNPFLHEFNGNLFHNDNLKVKTQENTVGILSIKNNEKLFYTVDAQFSYWVLWNKNNPLNSFLCIEPQTWAINAPNENNPVSYGYYELPFYKKWTAISQFSVEDHFFET